MEFKLLQEAANPAVKQDFGIGPKDYNAWLRAIRSIAKEEGNNINKRGKFDEIAFEVLDNDPAMDSLGGDEKAKIKIVNALWHKHQQSVTGDAASKEATRASKRVAKEEEEFTRMSGTEGGTNVQSAGKQHSAIQKVISDAYNKGKTTEPQKAARVKNPYESGTSRNKLWQNAFKRGCAAYVPVRLGNEDQSGEDGGGAEEEELDDFDLGVEREREHLDADHDDYVDDMDSHRREGFIACAQAIADAPEELSDFPEMVNPYDEGTSEADAFEEGWKQACHSITDLMGNAEGGEGASLDLEDDEPFDGGSLGDYNDEEDMKSDVFTQTGPPSNVTF